MSAKPRGLGRGLDDLLPKVEKGIRKISLQQLNVSPLQPRRTLDNAAISELAASIQRQGVLQPILVREVGTGFEIIAGERRYRAAKRAGLSEVPVIVKKLSDQQALEIAIVENLQREDLNPVDEARAFERLLAFGLTQEKVAKAVGKSRSAVANTLRLLSLPQSCLDAVVEGRISAGHARALLSLDEDERDWALDQVVARQLSVRETEKLRQPKVARPMENINQPYADLERGLTRHISTQVTIRGEKRGKIELHFHSRDELERLIELLGYVP
ncbi:MAG: chromosome partitioning protein ParB [Trueperaceae bacterium]|nr:chromosome partitioning protein ParB [Trueperaceae bacterium]